MVFVSFATLTSSSYLTPPSHLTTRYATVLHFTLGRYAPRYARLVATLPRPTLSQLPPPTPHISLHCSMLNHLVLEIVS